MGNIAIHKENGNRQAPLARSSQSPQWEPFRMMRDLMGWDPFREMTPFATEVAAFTPSFEIKETKEAFVFKADVPGVKEADIELTVTGNRLTISGKREAEHQEQTDMYYAFERSYGTFTRAFTLPDGIDENAVTADLKEGVLTIAVKKRPEMQPKKIPIQSAAKKA